MSHLNGIAGFQTAAADYQAYLEQLKAARNAIREEHPGKGSPTKTFDTEIDPDASAGDNDDSPGHSGEAFSQEPGPEQPEEGAIEGDSDGTSEGVGYYA